MMVWVDTLLPEPDSPTMPRVCPASTSNETPADGLHNAVRRAE